MIDSNNNHPHIVRLFDTDSDIQAEYFVIIEQEVTVQCRSITNAVFALFAVHYVFNIEYHAKVKDVLYFIQDVVLGCPDTNFKKSAQYSSVVAALSCVSD